MRLFATRLTAIAATLRRAWSPTSLFAASEQGVWYDPSDMSTMYQDAAGTTPVYMPGQGQVDPPVGLLLDKRLGLARGPELVSNGDFATDTWWSKDTGVAITGGACVFSATTSRGVYRSSLTQVGKCYVVTYTVVVNSGAIRPLIAGSFGVSRTTSGTYTEVLSGTSGALFGLFANPSFDGAVDNVSLREVLGNHAYQTTTTSRPTLSARYNLLVSSENLASGWSVFNGAFTQAGDYWKFTENTTANLHSFLQTPSQPKAALYRATFTGKPAGRSIVRFVLNAYSGNFAEVRFDLAAGTVVGVFTGGDGVVSSYSIAPAGDGGYSCTIVGKPSAAASGIAFDVSLGLVDGGNSSYTGDGVSGILVNKFDCRSASDGVGLPPYQRVVDANTYDTVGFPPYLKFDGVDDFLQTASVDFSGTDKLFASAALRKLSDAAAGIVVELSLVSNSNPGAFALLAPSGAIPTMGVYLRGATTLVTNTLSGIASPASGVLTGVFDLAAAITQQARSRINGQPAGVSTSSDVGGGVFGSYPLYVGKRGLNASTMFNGRLYSLVIRGADTPDATIATVERYLNSKARIY